LGDQSGRGGPDAHDNSVVRDRIPCNHTAVGERVELVWRGPVTDDEMVALVTSHGGNPVAGWWDRIREHSLGWVSARAGDETLVGFVNLAWDGGDHAFLIDTKVSTAYQHRGIGTDLVRCATVHAKAAGCEWLHVDFLDELGPFYFDACEFRPTHAGLIYLPNTTP
jgi:GNAT superfamily N-acetyltransferase